MARRRTNREIEQFCYERYAADFPELPGTVQYTDRPDVIVHAELRVGIEVARLYLSPGADSKSEQVQSLRRDEALRLAFEIHRNAGLPAFELHVSFNARNPINDVDMLAVKIANVARGIAQSTAGMVPRSRFAAIGEVRDIYFNPGIYDDARWLVSQVHTVPELSVEAIVAIVRKKDRLLETYQACDEYRLLLIVDLMDPAMDQDLSWPKGAEAIPTLFSEVAIYCPQSKSRLLVPISGDLADRAT